MGGVFGGGGSNKAAIAQAEESRKRAEEQAAELEAERERQKKKEREAIEEEAADRLSSLRAFYSGSRGSRSLLGPSGSAAGYRNSLG